jgi:hypothetical protein
MYKCKRYNEKNNFITIFGFYRHDKISFNELYFCYLSPMMFVLIMNFRGRFCLMFNLHLYFFNPVFAGF